MWSFYSIHTHRQQLFSIILSNYSIGNTSKTRANIKSQATPVIISSARLSGLHCLLPPILQLLIVCASFISDDKKPGLFLVRAYHYDSLILIVLAQT